MSLLPAWHPKPAPQGAALHRSLALLMEAHLLPVQQLAVL